MNKKQLNDLFYTKWVGEISKQEYKTKREQKELMELLK
jgi:hypothetical protein